MLQQLLLFVYNDSSGMSQQYEHTLHKTYNFSTVLFPSQPFSHDWQHCPFTHPNDKVSGGSSVTNNSNLLAEWASYCWTVSIQQLL